MSTALREARWRSEAAFFDQQAEQAAARLAPLDPRTVARYRSLRAAFAPEFRFGVLGDLRGRRVLDVGCGEGPNSVLLALLGARVTGLDLSSGALEVARQRAALNGVADILHVRVLADRDRRFPMAASTWCSATPSCIMCSTTSMRRCGAWWAGSGRAERSSASSP